VARQGLEPVLEAFWARARAEDPAAEARAQEWEP
jgi:hypothetical protein